MVVSRGAMVRRGALHAYGEELKEESQAGRFNIAEMDDVRSPFWCRTWGAFTGRRLQAGRVKSCRAIVVPPHALTIPVPGVNFTSGQAMGFPLIDENPSSENQL